ncbi:hypothetical protein [Streptomyces sp. NPDC056061]|uniref:hypothetical protein n=1 Tax=Streptomyces sp. NPDC056061 TaxID=3345700 RepID=UPI0035DEE1D4
MAEAGHVLGTGADAEDAVRDGWITWPAADRSRVAGPKVHPMRIVSYPALEQPRSAPRADPPRIAGRPVA